MAVVYADLTDPTRAYGLAVSVEGSPYLFATGGVTGYAFTGDRDPDWARSVAEWTVLSGYLDARAGISWTERVQPLKGDVEVSGITFRLHDQSPSTGPAVGQPVMSYLTTREDIPSTPLAASIDDLDTTLTVEDGSIFGSANFPVWIDREAMWCTSRTGNVLTLNVPDIERGIYGSKGRPHYVDSETGYAPEVYATFPFLERRRVILWMGPVLAGLLTDPVPLWRGFVNTGAPRLAADGARWELFCDHVTALLGNATLGVAPASCTVQGYFSAYPYAACGAIVSGRTNAGVDFVAAGLMANGASGSTPRYYSTLDELLADVAGQVDTRVRSAGLTAQIHITAGGREVSLTGNVTDGRNLHAELFLNTNAPAAVERTVTDSATGDLPPVSIGNFPLALSSVSLSSLDPQPVRMASVANLPTTNWPYANGGAYATRAVLTATTGDYRVELIPTDADIAANTVVSTSARTVKGYLRFYRGSNATPLPLDGAGIDGVLGFCHSDAYLLAPLTFRVATTIDTPVWAQGFRDLTSNSGLGIGGIPWPGNDVDYRDWDWTRVDRIAAAVPPLLARRHWLFDGTQNVRDVLAMNEMFSGGAPGIRRSRIAPDVFAPPTQSDVYDAAHTFSAAGSTYLERPGFVVAPDGIANSVSVKLGNSTDAGTTTWVLQDQRSVARWGARRLPDLEVRGLEATPEMLAQGPRALQQYLTSRIMALWSVPVRVAKIRTTLSRLDTVYLMDDVRIDGDAFLPNAGGGRGWDGVGATVIGREVKLTAGGGALAGDITFEVMHWPYNQLGGWAPCARVATSTAGTKTITLATGYLTGGSAFGEVLAPTDYAGSNRDGYADSGVGSGTVANDGGAGFFVAGDAVELVFRDATTSITESLTIASVTPATKTIVFTTAQAAKWADYLAAGLTVDLRYLSDYEAGTAGQQRYAFVGGRAGHDIEGNSDHPNFRWSP